MSNVTDPSRVDKVQSRAPKQARFLRPMNQLAGFVLLVLKRQRHQLSLTLLALVSIILAVGLVTNTAFFSQAVDRVILLSNLKEFSKATGRPPFSTSVYFFPSQEKPVSIPDAENLSGQVASIMASKVGLPLRHQGLQVSSGGLLLQPDKDSTQYATGTSGFLDTTEVVYIQGVADHINIVAGAPYLENGSSSSSVGGREVVDVWIHEKFSQKLGANVGETFKIGVTLNSSSTTIRVAGFWHSKGPDSSFWFNDPDLLLDSAILIHRDDFIKFIQPILAPMMSRDVSWYIIFDESRIRPSDSASYLDGYKQASTLINRTLPGARLNAPPLEPLEDFLERSNSLTILLLGYNLPAFFVLLYFLILCSSIVARWQRKDMLLLIGRGMSISGVLNLVLLDQLLLFVVGYPLGIGFGMLIARLMGYCTSFLNFADRAALPVSLDDVSIPLTILALGVALLARLSPAVQAARESRHVEERKWARTSPQPFWYRYYIDLALILPTYYAYDQMIKNGSLGNLLVNNRPDDLYQDPLLILVPALFIITASLVLMRLFSVVMRLIDIPASHSPWLTIHLALRQLSRQSEDYIRPLMLVVVTLALGVYTLSMSASLDRWLVDRLYYRSGADFSFRPLPANAIEEPQDAGWVPPMDEFRKLPGVLGATRVSTFNVQLSTEFVIRANSAAPAPNLTQNRGQAPGQNRNQNISIRMVALDAQEFASVTWFRSDFSQESLNAMLNRLASRADGVLVPREILTQYDLQIGDQFGATVGTSYSMRVAGQFTIVGTYDYFPTVYPENGVTLIGNLENLCDQFGFTLPHRIWLKLAPGVSGDTILKTIYNTLQTQPQLNATEDTRFNIITEQSKMERVGIFGTLSMGFLATAFMAMLGLLIYSYASLRERVYHLAMLLAVGVSRSQVIAQVVLEYTFLCLFGVAAGAAIGITASNLFVPFFRFTGEKGGIPLPPLLPIIAWPEIVTLTLIFTVLIVVAEVVTITLSLRDRIGQLLKDV